MPDMEVTDTRDGWAAECFLCHTSTGPFVRVKMMTAKVGTAEGLVSLRGEVLICVGLGDGAEAEYGCARQLGQLSGCATPAETVGLVATADAYATNVRELEAKLAEALAEPKVVNVDDLMERVADTMKPAKTPRARQS